MKGEEEGDGEFHDSHFVKLGKTLLLGLTFFFVVSGEKKLQGILLHFEFLALEISYRERVILSCS